MAISETKDIAEIEGLGDVAMAPDVGTTFRMSLAVNELWREITAWGFRMMVCCQSTPSTSVDRSLWIRSRGDRNCSRRATVRLGIDTSIANILVFHTLMPNSKRTWQMCSENKWTKRVSYFKSSDFAGRPSHARPQRLHNMVQYQRGVAAVWRLPFPRRESNQGPTEDLFRCQIPLFRPAADTLRLPSTRGVSRRHACEITRVFVLVCFVQTPKPIKIMHLVNNWQ